MPQNRTGLCRSAWESSQTICYHRGTRQYILIEPFLLKTRTWYRLVLRRYQGTTIRSMGRTRSLDEAVNLLRDTAGRLNREDPHWCMGTTRLLISEHTKPDGFFQMPVAFFDWKACYACWVEQTAPRRFELKCQPLRGAGFTLCSFPGKAAALTHILSIRDAQAAKYSIPVNENMPVILEHLAHGMQQYIQLRGHREGLLEQIDRLHQLGLPLSDKRILHLGHEAEACLEQERCLARTCRFTPALARIYLQGRGHPSDQPHE